MNINPAIQPQNLRTRASSSWQVEPSTLGVQTILSLLVLGNLVKGVLLAVLPLAEGLLGLWNVHLHVPSELSFNIFLDLTKNWHLKAFIPNHNKGRTTTNKHNERDLAIPIMKTSLLQKCLPHRCARNSKH